MSKKTKILLLAPITSLAGGIANWTKILLCSNRSNEVEYIVLDTSVHYRVLGGRSGIKEITCGIRDGLVRFVKLIRHVVRDKPDIVYFTCSPSIGFVFRDVPLVLFSKLFRQKVIIHLRGGDIDGFWGGNFIRKKISRLGSRLADYIFVITRECETVTRKWFDLKKVIYIPNYIKTNCLDNLSNQIPAEIKANKFNVIHVAFQCEVKGTFQIIEAAKYLDDDVNILLIGPVASEQKISIDEAIRRGKVQSKVTVIGPKNKPEVWHYYKNADLFLFPTHSEGFPNVILEAMLCKLPIVSTGVGNIQEIVGAESNKPAALILKNSIPPEAKEIAELVTKLKNDNFLRKKLAENGYSRVCKNYSTDVVIPALEKILNAINNNEDVLKVANDFFEQKL